MEIRNNEVHIHDVRLYGCDGNTFTDYEEVAGCPYLYKMKLEGKEEIIESYPLLYGRMIHKILWAVEKEDLSPEEALKKYFDPKVGSEGFDEAMIDLERMMARSEQNLVTLDSEVFLRLPLFEYKGKTYWYVGTLDKVEYNPDDKEIMYYRDFKSNRSPFSQAQLDRDIQFTGYNVLLEENLGRFCKMTGQDPEKIRVVGILDAIKFYTLYTARSYSQKDRFKAWIESMARMILDDKKGRQVLNSGCGYCHVRYECKEFKKLDKTGEKFLLEIGDAKKLGERVKVMHKLKELRGLIDKEIKMVQDELKKYPGVYDGVDYKMVQKFKKVIDLPKLHKEVGIDFYRLVNLVMRELNNYMYDHPELEPVVKSMIKEIHDGYTLSSSAVK